MATLTQLTLDADGTIDTANIEHDAGTGSPYVGHCNDAPDGLSSDWVGNDTDEASGTAWFSLDDVDADFGSMATLNIDVDVDSTGFVNDTCTLTARIFDADNDISNPLTDESGNLATEADSTRIQRNVSFAGLAGSKAQWDAAHIRFTWTYNQVTSPDNAQVRLYGCDIDGTYNAEASQVDTRNKRFSMMNVGWNAPGVMANPDGAIAAADRAQLMWIYAGIVLDGAAGGRVMSSLAGSGGLAGHGGIAGHGGGLAG